MFQFLQPIWLLAIAGIIFPVLIHLWNIKTGKTLKIGSVFLLAESARQQARSFRLKDLLLLVLRCFMITALALLLTKPLWQKQLQTKDRKGWVLLDQENINESYHAFKPYIDSLLASGFELHYFNNGFQKVKLEEALKKGKDSTDEDISYWTMLKQLDEQVPADLPMYLFTHNRLNRFTGTRPEVALQLHWNTYTSLDSTAQYIVNARLSSTDSIRAVIAQSNAAVLHYSTRDIAMNNLESDFKLQHTGEKLFISITDTTPGVEVDTATQKIIIYTDQLFTDANYIKAAIDAIQQFGKYRMNVEISSAVNSIPPDFDWLFWLSQKNVPASLQKNNVLMYENGKEKTTHSWLQIGDQLSPVTVAIHLSKLIVKKDTDTFNEAVWTDGFGKPILSLEKNTNRVYHFYSRFNPAWNDLVWSEQFPQLIFKLLIKREHNKTEKDKRTIDANQLQPTIIQQNSPYRKQNFVETTDLSKALWILAFVLFCLERYISLYRKKESYA